MGAIGGRNYDPKRTPEQAVREKMKVLREFFVVDDDNYDSIYKELLGRVCMHPEYDFDRVLDRAARTMIDDRLGRIV